MKTLSKWFKRKFSNTVTEVKNVCVDLSNLDKSDDQLNEALCEISSLSSSIVDSIKSSPSVVLKDKPSDKYECLTVLYEALNMSEDIICLTDSHSKIIYANKAYLDTYGFICTSELIGRYANIVKSGLTKKETFTEMWGNIRSGKSWDGIVINKNTMGKLVEVHSSIVPITSHTGTTDYYICVQRVLEGCK